MSGRKQEERRGGGGLVFEETLNIPFHEKEEEKDAMKESEFLTSFLRVKKERSRAQPTIFVHTERRKRQEQNLVFFKAVILNKKSVERTATTGCF